MSRIAQKVISTITNNPKTLNTNLLKAGGAVASALTAGALLKPKEEDKTLDYMSSMPSTLSSRTTVFRTEKPKDNIDNTMEKILNDPNSGLSPEIREMLKKLEQIRETKIDNPTSREYDDLFDFDY